METATTTTTVWNIDPMHSEVQFKVRHLVISTVTGSFERFEGRINAAGEDFNGAEASFQANVQSLNTGVADRDNHLRSDDFFSAEKHPTIDFKGQFNKTGGNQYTLAGPLTIKGNTLNVTLQATFGGTMVDGYGQTKAGFEITGTINRKEFGLTWNQVTEAGGVVVGDEVKLNFNVQFTKG